MYLQNVFCFYFTASFIDRGERFAESTQEKNDKDVAKIHYISGENSCLQTTQSLTMTTTAQNNVSVTATSVDATTTATTTTTVETTSPAIAPSENYSYVTLTAVRLVSALICFCFFLNIARYSSFSCTFVGS